MCRSQESQLTFVFDSATDLTKIERIVNELGLEKNKKIAIHLAGMSSKPLSSVRYLKGEPIPFNLTIDHGCSFSPCEELTSYIQTESPKLVYIINDNDDFICNLPGNTYRLRNTTELRDQLERKLKSKKDRLTNASIFIYFEGDFQARKPTVVVNDAIINEGESVSLKAAGNPSGGEYFWPELGVNGQNVNKKFEASADIKVMYGIDNCWSDTAFASITVKPSPPCSNFSKPSLISVLDSYTAYLEFNEDYKEYTFYPDNSTDNYVIQLDSVCPPSLIEIKLIDPDNGRPRTLLEKQDFRIKVNDDRRKVLDESKVYEITVEKSLFAYNAEERRGKTFITTKRYQMVISFYFKDGSGDLILRETEPIDVLFNQCAR
jgi:hypothetical protein